MKALTLPKRLLIFDLDGVIYRGLTPTPGAAEVMSRLREREFLLRFLTNNSSQSRLSYCQKLTGMGIAASPEEIMTSAYATALYLRREGFCGKSVLVVGEEGLCQELEQAGIHALPSGESYRGQPVGAVVAGIDRSFTYQRLAQAQQAIVIGGARFIATNQDPTYPTEEGDFPGGGSIVAAIETASGQKPVLVGKPNVFALDLLLQAADVAYPQALLIGDRLDTDIHVGNLAGMETVLTLTGVTSRTQAQEAPPALSPDLIIEDLRQLESLLG